MLVKRILLVLAIASVVLAAWGCAPSIVTSDAGVYSGGTLYALTSEDLTTVYNAALKALNDLELDITDKAKDVFYARITAKGADGSRIRVHIRPKEDGGTDLSIKVGSFGDEHKSGMIYQRIRQNLGLSEK